MFLYHNLLPFVDKTKSEDHGRMQAPKAKYGPMQRPVYKNASFILEVLANSPATGNGEERFLNISLYSLFSSSQLCKTPGKPCLLSMAMFINQTVNSQEPKPTYIQSDLSCRWQFSLFHPFPFSHCQGWKPYCITTVIFLRSLNLPARCIGIWGV